MKIYQLNLLRSAALAVMVISAGCAGTNPGEAGSAVAAPLPPPAQPVAEVYAPTQSGSKGAKVGPVKVTQFPAAFRGRFNANLENAGRGVCQRDGLVTVTAQKLSYEQEGLIPGQDEVAGGIAEIRLVDATYDEAAGVIQGTVVKTWNKSRTRTKAIFRVVPGSRALVFNDEGPRIEPGSTPRTRCRSVGK